ncbi:MAG: DUF4293 family protein [Bacteroidales bacterium]|jgi:hypothetical protein|nr:DUF4293 family protein [Bacteroidales bacterium]
MKKINYLTLILASAVLLGIMLFGEIYRAYPPFLVLTIIAFLICLVNLFLIHHKKLQLRLCIYTSIVLLAYQAWIVYLLWFTDIKVVRFPVSTIFPIICVILNIIAIGILRKTIAAEEFMELMKRRQEKKK